MITAFIVEDESNSRDSLIRDLKALCEGIEVIGHAAGVEEAFKQIPVLKPQLLFLDIEIGGGTSFDLLDKLRAAGCTGYQVIFATSHNEYAIKAFRFSAIDYLMKPVDPDELVQAVSKISERKAVPEMDNLKMLLESMSAPKNKFARIALAAGDSILVYKTDEIIRCESERNYTRFYFLKEKPLLVSKTLKDYENLLVPEGFERVHQSHLVNMVHVKKYVKSDGGYLVMHDDASVPVSQHKKELVVRLLSGK